MKYAEFMRCAWVILAIFCAVALSAQAGGGPQNVLVVVNDNSLESLELGQYYREKRGIPEANVLHIQTTTNWNINTVAFSNQIRGPILNYIATSGLSNQIDYVVFSRDIPYRVYAEPYSSNRFSALTASMFYDFKSSPDAFVYDCDLAAGSVSPYYEVERSFTHSGAPSSNRYYLSTILTGWDMAQSKTLVDRSVLADGSFPTSTVFLLHTLLMWVRNVQWGQYENEDFMARFLSIPQDRQILQAEAISGRTNVMGYMVGSLYVNNLDSNYFLNGALAEHLTSFGGCLFDHDPHEPGQMSILEWIRVGCVGSYGTVVEPCAYTNKFPQARVHYWYGRGFNMGESYWMSVQNPYQGVFVGDPLCAPYATPPAIALGGLLSGQVVTGAVSITVTGSAAAVDQRVDQIDLCLDGTWLATLTNVAPTRFNTVSATIKGTTRTYTVGLGNSLYAVASGLAAAINQAPPLGVTAKAYGDRIEVIQNAKGTTGAWMSVSATSGIGSASRLTTYAWSTHTNFLETAQYAHEEITLSGTPVSGDVVRAVVTDLNGITLTNEAAASTNDTAWTLMGRLAEVVGSNITLQASTGCELTWLYNGPTWGEPVSAYFRARTNTWQGYNLYLVYSVSNQPGSTLTGPGFSDYLNDNSDVLSARATIFLAEGFTNLSAAYSLDTTNLADGSHELMAVTYDGSAVRTQERIVVPFVVDNNTATCEITNPVVASTFLLGETITAHVYATAGAPVTSVAFYAEGKWVAATGTVPYVFSLSTTNYGVGTVDLQAKAMATNGEAVLSSNVTVTILPDYDFDGLDDNWEVRNFDSITNYNGSDDPDLDGADNRNEFTADTQPTNIASFFKVSRIEWNNGIMQLEFISSTARQYRLHYTSDSLLDGLWFESSNWLWGGSGITTQRDDGTIMPAPTNSQRFYRVRAHRP